MFSGLREKAPEAPGHCLAHECAVERFHSELVSLPHMTTRGDIAMQARMGLSLRKPTPIAITAHVITATLLMIALRPLNARASSKETIDDPHTTARSQPSGQQPPSYEMERDCSGLATQRKEGRDSRFTCFSRKPRHRKATQMAEVGVDSLSVYIPGFLASTNFRTASTKGRNQHTE